MVLRSGFLLIATRLQEAADMAHSNVRSMLSKAVQDAHPNKYAYYQDHTGDGESGDCIYGCDGDMHSAPYSISTVGGKHTANLDTSNAQKVQSVVTYKPMADDDDHYTAMESAFKASKLYTDLPLYERFISKKERDAASDDDFAGKGKSFPILKPSDVSAAVHAMGRAGSDNLGMAALKARIIAIAKRKGWTAELPKAWQEGGGDSKESAAPANDGALKLCESATMPEPIKFTEAFKAGYQIKIIAPGKGSTAFYPAEVLKRDGPKVFTAGTHVYMNHATAAEESQRPGGSVQNLAGVLAKDAVYLESHKNGPGLYSEVKPFTDHAQAFDEKGPYVGMSIRASGIAESDNGKTRLKDGVPVLKELTAAESVDMVTRAGAGGMVLQESATAQPQGSEDMTEQEKTLLQEAGRLVLNEKATKFVATTLAGISLSEAGKAEVVRRVLEHIPTQGGLLDEAKFKTLIETEAQNVGRFMSQMGYRGVVGMGQSGAGTTQLTEKQQRKAFKEAKRQREALSEARTDIFAGIMGGGKAAEFAAKGRAA